MNRKRIFGILMIFAFGTLVVNAQDKAVEKIKWLSLEEAQQAVKSEKRLILLDVYTDWCGPCKLMMRTTFNDPRVIEYVNDNFYAVKFNGQGPDPVVFKGKTYSNPRFNKKLGTRTRNSQHQLTAALQVRAYPTLLFLDENFNLVKRSLGYKNASDFLGLMNTVTN